MSLFCSSTFGIGRVQHPNSNVGFDIIQKQQEKRIPKLDGFLFIKQLL